MGKNKRTIRKRKKQEIVLRHGIYLMLEPNLPASERKVKLEDRLLELFVNGILVFLLTAGGIGGYLNSIGIEYSVGILYLGLAVCSILCGVLGFNFFTRFLGGLALVSVLGVYFYYDLQQVLGGLFVIINQSLSQIAEYFNLSDFKTFPEYPDPYTAVTIGALWLGCCFCVLNSFFIIRYLDYSFVIVAGFFLFLFPFYMKLEPDLLSMILMFSGLAGVYVLRKNFRNSKKKGKNYFRKDWRQKWYLTMDASAETGALFWISAICILVFVPLSVLIPRQAYFDYQGESVVKQKDMAYLDENLDSESDSNIAAGGISNGRLGTVKRVLLDYGTDLIVRFTPYQASSFYLRSFVGAEYIPFENQWMEDEAPDVMTEAKALSLSYQAEEPFSNCGVVEIENVSAAKAVYQPYYYRKEAYTIRRGKTERFLYFPENRSVDLELEPPKDWGFWLQVPQENQEVISKLCQEQGFVSDIDLLTQQIQDYFQENIPYTLNPGTTPANQDFINYFLSENKKGYCMHFASAAVLIFRYCSIPARYVEGYVVPYDKILEGKIIEEADYEEYFAGYSALGQTPLTEVELTDEQAHAWVEVFDESTGWRVVEVTPSSEEETISWNKLFKEWRDKTSKWEESKNMVKEETERNHSFGRTMGKWVIHCLLVLFVAGTAGVAYKGMKIWKAYQHSGWNDRLILRYQFWLKRHKSAIPELKKLLNYQEQLSFLKGKGIIKLSEEEFSELERVLDRAGFSSEEITKQEFENAVTLLKRRKPSK